MKPLIVPREVGGELPAWAGQLHPVLARVYAARGVGSVDELEYGLGGLLPATALAGMGAAVGLLEQALEKRWRILVVGDFDADGATSTALALRALRALGAAAVDYLVPNRFEYGYGLTPEIVAVAADRRPDLIITVDNGISSIAGVAAARERGIRVLVTDHHLPGAELPAADAIVNPNQPGDGFASKNLAGVGVIFYVMLALRAHLRGHGWFERRGIAEPNLARFLDLVALGTVADVVPLDRNNRVLVAQGLARIRSGSCCAGITALLAVAGRDPGRLVAADLGFTVGPRLNAAGRLDDMSHGIECLLADAPGEARRLAGELDRLNRERREIETRMREEALAAVAAMEGEEASDRLGVILFREDWHQGVVGLVASRIKERLHRPVIAFAPAGDGDELRGSARSVPGVHIRDLLDTIAARHPGLLIKFGGHAMAAGLSLLRPDLEAFDAAFNRELARLVSLEDLRGRIRSDGVLEASEFSLDLAQRIREGGPWGQGFPEPLFHGEFEVLSQRPVGGDRHLKLQLGHPGVERLLDAIAFNVEADLLESPLTRVLVVYRLDVNEYRGRRSLQLLIERLHPL